jgi:hypothetical protein
MKITFIFKRKMNVLNRQYTLGNVLILGSDYINDFVVHKGKVKFSPLQALEPC